MENLMQIEEDVICKRQCSLHSWLREPLLNVLFVHPYDVFYINELYLSWVFIDWQLLPLSQFSLNQVDIARHLWSTKFIAV